MPVCFAKGKILCAYASQATPAISPQGPVQVVLQLAKAGGGRGGARGWHPPRAAEQQSSQGFGLGVSQTSVVRIASSQ